MANGYDPIAETEAHAQALRQQMFPGAEPSRMTAASMSRPATADDRRNYLVNQLQYANRRQLPRIVAELHALDRAQAFDVHAADAERRQMDFEANQERMLAHANALEMDRAIRRERDTRIDSMGADAMIRMHDLDTALHTGQIDRGQYDDQMLALGKTHFEALHRHPEAAKHWAAYLDQDQKMSQYQERLDLREAAKLQAKYGVPIQVDENTGQIDFESMQNSVLQTPRGKSEALQHLNTQMIRQYGLPIQAVFEHAAGGRMDNPSDPNSFKQTDPNDKVNPQTHVRMSIVSPTGTTRNVFLDKPRFDALKAQFEPAYRAVVGQPGAVATTEPAAATTTAPAATVRMRSPDGAERDVPSDQVQHYQGLGATVVNQ